MGHFVVELPKKPHRGRLRPEEEDEYVSQLDESQKEAYEAQKQARQSQSTVGSMFTGTRKRGSSDGLDAPVTKGELSDILYQVFDGLGNWLDSDANWTEEEFGQISAGFLIIINRVRQLRIVTRFLTPVASVFGIVKKIRKLQDGRVGDGATARIHRQQSSTESPGQSGTDRTA